VLYISLQHLSFIILQLITLFLQILLNGGARIVPVLLAQVNICPMPMRILPVVRLTHRDMAAIKEAIDYVETHSNEKVSADDLSEQFLIPVKKLQAGFRRQTGYTVHDYLSTIRLKQAKVLLLGDDPIKNVAEKTGLKNQSYFGQFFKKFTGQTPAEFRNKQQT
jgi:AraC-like DNA-binding protein